VLDNRHGRRFFDEGEDFQFYTYAKLGGIILNEPSGVGYQIFDKGGAFSTTSISPGPPLTTASPMSGW